MDDQTRYSLSRRALTYCRDHAALFSHELKSQSYDLLTARFYVLTGLFVVAGFANMPFLGWLAIVYILPISLLSITPKVMALANFGNLCRRFSPIIINILTCGALVSIALLFVKIDERGLAPDSNPPIQIVLALFLGLTSHYSRFQVIAAVNALMTLTFVSIFAIFDRKIIGWSAAQFLGGYGIGTFLASLHLYFRQVNFMMQDLEKRLNSHLFKELEALVYPHQKGLLEAYQSLTDTMPLGPVLGGLGEFDIINSSQMPFKEIYHRGKNTIFGKCYARMLRNYQINPSAPATPTCDGHLVKELGDGFIFSAGFPFSLPRGKGYAEIGLQLGVDFIKEFEEHKAELGADASARCVVVLVKQELEAFWTFYKVRHFDLKQQCVTKVTRFQEMRRLLLSKQIVAPESSFILAEDAFFNDLPTEHQTGFSRINLKEHGLQVRGSSNTCELYMLEPLGFREMQIVA